MMRKNKFLSTLLALTMTAGMLAGTVSTVYAEGDNEATLDLESSDTYANTQTVDQNYTLTVDNGYTDATQIVLDWATVDIAVTRDDSKIWDPENLTWKTPEDGYGTPDITAGTATFNLTNRSTVKVNAAVTFAQESSFTAPTIAFSGDTADGTVTIGTAVKGDKTVDSSIDHDASIGVTVTPVQADFKTLDAATGTKYGTYTITLSAIPRVTTYTMTNQPYKVLSSADMLDTISSAVTYTYDNQTCTAYNGYISATQYANWTDAITFVENLNKNEITPSGKTYGTGAGEGTWRLLKSQSDAQAWATATGVTSSTNFNYVYWLFSSVAGGEGMEQYAYMYNCSNSFWGLTDKSSSDTGTGFVVIWAQNDTQ